MTDYYPHGTGDLVALPILKDGVAATSTSVSSVNIAAYTPGSTPPTTYPIAAQWVDNAWCFPVASLGVGTWAIRAQVNAPGETGILLDFGTVTVVP